jgi:hypothetical protein
VSGVQSPGPRRRECRQLVDVCAAHAISSYDDRRRCSLRVHPDTVPRPHSPDDRLADQYNTNWAYSPEFITWMTGHIPDRRDHVPVSGSRTSAAVPALSSAQAEPCPRPRHPQARASVARMESPSLGLKVTLQEQQETEPVFLPVC